MNSFYTNDEIAAIPFKSIGINILISKKTSIYNPELISIGNNVRIDDFCILSGDITIGNNIHISAYSVLYGIGGIELMDYSGISARCTILSVTDDFSGNFLVGPFVDQNLRNVIKKKIVLHPFVQIGAGTVIMPGVVCQEGSAVGAMSFVRSPLDSWWIYAGIPAKKIKIRSKKMISMFENSK